MNKTLKNNKYNKIRKKTKISKKHGGGPRKSPGAKAQFERLERAKNSYAKKIQNAYRKQRNKGIQAAQGAIDAEKRRIAAMPDIQSAIDTLLPNPTITQSRIPKLESMELEQQKSQTPKRESMFGLKSGKKQKDQLEFSTKLADTTETVSPFKKFKKGVGNRIGTLKQKLTPDPKIRTVKNRQSIEAKVHDDSTGVELEDLARAPSSDPELNQENLIPEQQNISANPNEQIYKNCLNLLTSNLVKYQTFEINNSVINSWFYNNDFISLLLSEANEDLLLKFDNINFSECKSSKKYLNPLVANNIDKYYQQIIKIKQQELKLIKELQEIENSEYYKEIEKNYEPSNLDIDLESVKEGDICQEYDVTDCPKDECKVVDDECVLNRGEIIMAGGANNSNLISSLQNLTISINNFYKNNRKVSEKEYNELIFNLKKNSNSIVNRATKIVSVLGDSLTSISVKIKSNIRDGLNSTSKQLDEKTIALIQKAKNLSDASIAAINLLNKGLSEFGTKTIGILSLGASETLKASSLAFSKILEGGNYITSQTLQLISSTSGKIKSLFGSIYEVIGNATYNVAKQAKKLKSKLLDPKIVDINCQEQILEKVLDLYQSGYNNKDKIIYTKNLVFNEDFMNLLRTGILTQQFSNVDSGNLNKCINLATSYNNLLDFFKNFNQSKQTIAEAEPINIVEGVHVNPSAVPANRVDLSLHKSYSLPSDGEHNPEIFTPYHSSTIDSQLGDPFPLSFSANKDDSLRPSSSYNPAGATFLKGGGIFSSSTTSANPFTRLKAMLSNFRTSIYNVTNKSFNINQKNYIQGFLNQKETEWNNSQIKTSIGSISSADRELLQKISNNYTSLSQNFYDVRSTLQQIPENIEQLIFKKLTLNELERQKLEDKIKKQLADQDDQEKGSQIKNLTEEKERLEKILEVYKQYGYIGLNPLDNDDQIKVVIPDSCGNIVHSDFSGVKGIVQNMIKFKKEQQKFNYYLHEFIENQSDANPDVPELPSILGGNNQFNQNLEDLKGDKYCLTNALNILLQKEAFSANQDICTNNPNDYFIFPQIGSLTKSQTLPIYIDKVKNILDLIGVNSDPLTPNKCSFNNDNPSQLKYLEFLLGLYGFKYQIIGSMSEGAPPSSDIGSSLPGSSLPSTLGSSIPSPISTPAPSRPPSPTPSIEDNEPLPGPPINTIFGISDGIVDSNRNIPNTLMPGFILLSESNGKVNYTIVTNDAFRPQSSVEDIRSAVKNNYQFRLVPDNLDLESKKYYNEKIDFNKIDAGVFNSADKFRIFINNQLNNKGVIPQIKKVIYIYNQNYNDADSEKREVINLYKNKKLLDDETLATINSDHSTVSPIIEKQEEDKKKEVTDSEKKAKIEEEIKELTIKLQENEVKINDLKEEQKKQKEYLEKATQKIEQNLNLKISHSKIEINSLNSRNMELQKLIDKPPPPASAKQAVSDKIKADASYANEKNKNQEKITELRKKIAEFSNDGYKNNLINDELKPLTPNSDIINLQNQIIKIENENAKIQEKIDSLRSELESTESDSSETTIGGSKNRKKSKKKEKKYSKSKNIFSRKKHKKVKNNKKNKSKKIKKHKQKSNKRGGYGAGDLKIVRPQITTTDAISAFLKEEHMKGDKFLLTNKKIEDLLKK